MIPRSRAMAWLTSHRSLVTTVTSATVVAALVAVAAATSTGYTAQKVELDDASVWVTSDVRQAAGRANPQIAELNTAVRMESGSLTVSQSGQTVVVSDLGRAEASIIDTSSAAVADTVSLPVGDVDFALAASVAVITSHTTGDVWITDTDSLAAFDAAAPPDLTLGAGGDTAVSAGGTVFGVSAATGSVIGVDPAAGADEATPWPIGVDADDDLSITAVGDRWVVLDRTAGRLITRDAAFDVAFDGAAATGAAGAVAPNDAAQNAAPDDAAPDDAASAPATAPERAWLQAPSAAHGGVLIATPQSLVEVSLTDGSVQVLSDGHAGTSVSPLEVAGCWYAGWSDGRSWSRCGDEAPTEGALEGAVAGDDLAFRTNGGGGVLLSDTVSGRSWDVTRQNAAIDNWSALLPDTSPDQPSNDTATDQPAEVDPLQRPPVATDDALGARPGRSTVLPVLQNDFDPNGDVIVVDSVRVPDDATFGVEKISDDQQLQLTLPPDAAGEISFGYTISDGRGGTADATVRVTVRIPGENSAPVQTTRQTIDVPVGGRGEADIRTGWFDPDGDAFYLQSANVAAPDAVTFTPAGVVTYSDAGQGAGARDLSIVVSDGQSSTAGSIAVEVHQPVDVPLVAKGFVMLAHVGEEVEVAPLAHVTGGTSALRLTNVPSHDGFAIAPDYTGGTVRITAQAVGSENLDYAVTDGTKTASGIIRVITTLAPDANTKPVTVPHAAFARQNTAVLVDVLATDFDPAGGVLIVSGVDGVSASDGVRVEIIEQRLLRVTLTRPLETGSTSFSYTVTNGLAEAEGSVSVVGIPDPLQRQPPVAVPDTAAVRVGDVVDIPVLANDVHPDGDPLTLDPDLVQSPGDDSGLLFTSGSHLRYLAPTTPGDFTAVYRVDAPDGQWATARVTISVREADATANAAPVPPLVTARVIAGESVRIPITLGGIDPDGDSVQFLGIDSVPDKGAVTDSGADWIDYVAGDYSTGTDTFSYTVLDRLGARATGTVRVGISPRLEGARNPVATPDEVLVRPGKTVLVRVLENDSDPDGSRLTLSEIAPVTAGAKATVVDNMLSFTAPAEPGRYGFIYTVSNARGGTSSSFATIDVRADAPLARPQVSDTVLSLTDILDTTSVDVDVLDNVFFAEGPATDLWLSVLPSSASVARVVDGRVRVTVHPQRQVIPFSVAHPDDPNVRSTGLIWVPGSDDALPQLRTDAPKLTVESGATLSIPLAAHVVAVGGRDVAVRDRNSVRATHADGGALVTDSHTLAFRSADNYYGPASISFEVSDGTGPDARSATLVLPITVTPRENQPPVFTGAVIEFEPGQQKVIDLAKLTTSPSGTSAAQLGYQLLDPRPAGFSAVLLGSSLTITVDVSTKKGAQGAFTIGVSDGATAGKAGRIEMSVVPSTRPLAIPATDTVLAPRGQTTTVDVLANDNATNPFPDKPLTVLAVRGADASSLPAGVSVVPSADKSVLQVTVGPDAASSDITVQYQVLDATADLERATWGTVRIAVLDRPGPVTGLQVTGFGDRSVTVAFTAGPANNSPITAFDVTARSDSGAVVTSRCASTSCTVGTPGNGPANAVVVSVTALNAIGASDTATYGVPVWSDLLPSPPGTLVVTPRDSALDVTWSAASVGPGGSPVREYDVAVDGRPVDTLDADGRNCSGTRCGTRIEGLANGTSVTVAVTARNSAYPALAVWPAASAAGTPFGAPSAAAVSAVADLSGGPGAVTVTWDEFAGNGDRVAGYFVQQLTPGSTSAPAGGQACSVSSPAPGTLDPPRAGGSVVAQQKFGSGAGSATFGGLTDIDTAYSFVVWGYNAAGCVASEVVSAVAYPSPGQVDAAALAASGMSLVQNDTIVDLRVDAAPTPNATSNPRYYVRPVDAGGNPVRGRTAFTLGGYPRGVTGGAFGEVYRFQLQACNVYGGAEVCGAFSDPVAAPGPSLTFDFAVPPVYADGAWTWVNGPANGSLTPQYSCGDGSVPVGDNPGGQTVTATSCTPASTGSGAPWLRLEIEPYDYVYRG
ncbi:Ig-like domain-containing protein [Herbiconiux daphne]|uniref:Ig-like domain-containing protein n=1 Tax=Herbiconiux daphne TaxID=2970914 RepID=A0ABT2H0Z4_9MICO|nr:Ig-like domain-containing protein [Herbiconiux daphne]MCS5733608.1 Ig-like domain-containing protein [Herbiconiux daphne]